jgi:hypothetical protein
MPETKTPNTELPRVLGEFGREFENAIIRDQHEQRLATTPPARPRRSRRRGFAIAFAAFAVVAVAVSLVVGFSRGGTSIGVQDALADVANRIIISPHPTPQQFQYTKSRGTGLGMISGGIDQMGRLYNTFLFVTPSEQEWAISIAHDGRGRTRGGKPIYPTLADAKSGKQYFSSFDQHQALLKTPAGRKRLHAINHRVMTYNKAHAITGTAGIEGPEWVPSTWSANGQLVFGGELLTPKQLAKYPRDPKAMFERMSKFAAKEQKEQAAFMKKLPAAQRSQFLEGPDQQDLIWSELTESSNIGLPADLLAARVRALAYLPGVEAAGEGTDAFGRHGTKFTWTQGGTRSEILFDKETAVLLMARATVVDPGALAVRQFRKLPAGTVTGSYQLIEQKTLNHLPKIP